MCMGACARCTSIVRLVAGICMQALDRRDHPSRHVLLFGLDLHQLYAVCYWLFAPLQYIIHNLHEVIKVTDWVAFIGSMVLHHFELQFLRMMKLSANKKFQLFLAYLGIRVHASNKSVKKTVPGANQVVSFAPACIGLLG